MDWIGQMVPDDPDMAYLVALATVVFVLAWHWRRLRIERKELQASKERPIYQHVFDPEPVLKRMNRERQILFMRHRAPVGSSAARARRVAIARAKLGGQDLLHEEL